MRDYIEERVLETAHYIVERGATVREAAKAFGISKSTVHKDMAERLKYINQNLYREVHAVLEHNKAERHIRGGMATYRKYKGEPISGESA
ncbi:MAG: sporulation transcriptional regulator SpoIIID [Clostridia bacterium]|nr:sporulation transcriptional regulator SpoIIID [Clostridia bacterium]